MIAVIGGGPAGLVAALAARQAGFDCTVYEQASGFAAVGGAVGIQSNGLAVLDALGLIERFRPMIRITLAAGVEAPPGNTVSRVDFTEIDHAFRGFAVAQRYDLQELLAAAAVEAGAQIRFGMRCTGVQSGGDEVDIRFADDTPEKAELVIACDGIHSAVRESLGVRTTKRLIGEAYLRAVAPIAHPEPARTGEYWAADGRRVGAFPLPGNRTYVFCSVPLGQWQEILHRQLDSWVQSWAAFGEPVATLMSSITDWDRAVYDELTDIRVDRWYCHRVFLAGDAVHAMTPNLGQGANSAMVDALVLVNLLVEHAPYADWARAGLLYEKLRKPFVTRIQNAALLGGQMASWTSAPARALRNTLLKALTRVGPMRRASMRLTAGYNPAEQEWLRPPRNFKQG